MKAKNTCSNPVSLGIFLLAFGYLYYETIYEMVMDWYIDSNYSHGFLIPFISGYFYWQLRDTIKNISKVPKNYGILLVFLGLFIYTAGDLSGELFTMRFSILVVLAGAIIFICGVEYFKKVSFPFFYLIFMIPLPYILYDTIAFPLKLFVTKLSVGILSDIGVLVMREGNIIHLVDTTLEVADACSGIRSIISLLALSTALAYITQKGWIKKIILIVLAVPIAVIVNSIRVIGTGILADKYGTVVAEGFFHEFAGLLIFGLALVMLVISSIILNRIKKYKG